MNTSLFDQVRQLSMEEQTELVEALWDNIVERNAVPGPTEAQKHGTKVNGKTWASNS
jgi:hypothetical protein